jgi:hypothetical protein
MMDSAWDVFPVLMIVLGVLGAAARIPMVVSPTWAKTMLRWMLQHRLMIHVMMLIVAILGGCFIWGARGLYESQPVRLWAVLVMFVMGVLMAAVGLVFLAVPRFVVTVAAYLKACSDVTIRLTAMLAVLISAFFAFAGYMLLV